MTSPELERLVQIGTLKREPGAQTEIDGLVRSARSRLTDAGRPDLAMESRFDLAYNAAHALSLAALRWRGYRSDNRYIVFQALPHGLGLGPAVWRVLATCHQRRNALEYEGYLEVDERLLADLLNAAEIVYEAFSGWVRSRARKAEQAREKGEVAGSNMATLTIEIPEDLLTTLQQSPVELERDVRLAAAIDWFRRGVISQGRAAEIAGIPRGDFIDELAARKIDSIHVDFEELKREIGLD